MLESGQTRFLCWTRLEAIPGVLRPEPNGLGILVGWMSRPLFLRRLFFRRNDGDGSRPIPLGIARSGGLHPRTAKCPFSLPFSLLRSGYSLMATQHASYVR